MALTRLNMAPQKSLMSCEVEGGETVSKNSFSVRLSAYSRMMLKVLLWMKLP